MEWGSGRLRCLSLHPYRPLLVLLLCVFVYVSYVIVNKRFYRNNNDNNRHGFVIHDEKEYDGKGLYSGSEYIIRHRYRLLRA